MKVGNFVPILTSAIFGSERVRMFMMEFSYRKSVVGCEVLVPHNLTLTGACKVNLLQMNTAVTTRFTFSWLFVSLLIQP